MSDPSKVQQYMSMLFHIIQERCKSDAFIGHVCTCNSNGWNLLINLRGSRTFTCLTLHQFSGGQLQNFVVFREES